MKKIYNLVELANVHEGNFEYLQKLLAEYYTVDDCNGIKLQVLHPDKIALPDFAWYKVYEQLVFDAQQWKQVITETAKYKEVWIDVFDEYGFEVVRDNIDRVVGIKFQASILFNKALITKFESLNFSDKRVIVNISGIAIDKIQSYIDEVQTKIKPKEIILQIGFQSYPTKLEDSGLIKIKQIIEKFGLQVSFADHIDATDKDALYLPIMAAMEGATFIEKHVKLTGTSPKYDFYSAIEKVSYVEYTERLSRFLSTQDQEFMNANEKKYLSTTIQMPILLADKVAGKNISVENDLNFKRTNSKGLRTDQLQDLLNNYYILANDKKANDVLLKEDFKKANIATIIACRMKSTRLPKKATVKIGKLSSVELCIKNCLKFNNVNHTILATSALDDDDELKNYTYSAQVIFHKGDPDDVMKRYLDVIDKLKIDVIVRVTADMQYVSDEILQFLLKSHFESGADYTAGTTAAIGTNLEVINTQALRYAKSFFPNANYSEYMTWYFKNNAEHFKLNIVDLPNDLVRDYRLTLDYPEDLALFEKIEEHFETNNLEFSLPVLFEYLDANPEVAKINSGLEVKYLTDKILIDTLNKVTKINI